MSSCTSTSLAAPTPTATPRCYAGWGRGHPTTRANHIRPNSWAPTTTADQQHPASCPSEGWSRHHLMEAQHLRTLCPPPHGDTMATTCRIGLPRCITNCRLCRQYPRARFSSFPLATTRTWPSLKTHHGSSIHRCCWQWSRPLVGLPHVHLRPHLGCTKRLPTSTRSRTCSVDAPALTRHRRAHHGHTVLRVVVDDGGHRSSRTPERRAVLQHGP